MKKLIPLLTLIIGISVPFSAYAACSTPVGEAGTAFYNTTVNAVQFCNGVDWYNTGLVAPSASGVACTAPTGPEGSAFYNTTQNTIQFCNGDDWVNMGTMSFPSASGTSCSAPTGAEGVMFFNTTTKTMQFCNGDNWVNATYLFIAENAIDGVELQKIQASDKEIGDQFGNSVSIFGDYAFVGSHYEDSRGGEAGAVYIFKRTGVNWTQHQKIYASNAQIGGNFGASVDVEGDYAIVGASGFGAYIFKFNGTIWSQDAMISAPSNSVGFSKFGYSVAISGDYIIVGDYIEDTFASYSGAAYIYKRIGNNWTLESKIKATDWAYNDRFGQTVSINGDYAIAGSPNKNVVGNYSGAAYVFKRSGSTWTQTQKIQSSDVQAGDQFGRAMSMMHDYIIIAAPYKSAGAVYVYKRSGNTWTQIQKIQGSDVTSGERFGFSLAVDNVDHLIVGTQNKDAGKGAAYIFQLINNNWVEQVKIQASDGQTNHEFGWSVGIDDGIAIVGARRENSIGDYTGAAYIFD